MYDYNQIKESISLDAKWPLEESDMEQEEIEKSWEFVQMFNKLSFQSRSAFGDYDNNEQIKIFKPLYHDYKVSNNLPYDEKQSEVFNYGYNSGVSHDSENDKYINFLWCLLMDYQTYEYGDYMECMLPIETMEDYEKSQKLEHDLKENHRKLTNLFSHDDLKIMEEVYQEY